MVFPKPKAHLRGIGARIFGTLFQALGGICDMLDPGEPRNVVDAAGYALRLNASRCREGEKIGKQAIRRRRLQHREQAAQSSQEPNQSLQCPSCCDVPYYLMLVTLF